MELYLHLFDSMGPLPGSIIQFFTELLKMPEILVES